MAPITGDEALLGQTQLQCYQLAIDDLNASGGIGGRQIVSIVEDDRKVRESLAQLIAYLKRMPGPGHVVPASAETGALATRGKSQNPTQGRSCLEEAAAFEPACDVHVMSSH